MTRRRSVFPLALLASFGLALATFAPASAQAPTLNVKLGLWETTSVVQMSGPPPIDMSTLTPEQRSRMEAAMANSAKAAATPRTMRSCLTKEKLADVPFWDKNNKSCKPTVVSSSTTEYAIKFSCKDEEGVTTSGQFQFNAATPELVKGGGDMTIERAGQKMASKMTMTSKWIGAECGNVK